MPDILVAESQKYTAERVFLVQGFNLIKVHYFIQVYVIDQERCGQFRYDVARDGDFGSNDAVYGDKTGDSDTFDSESGRNNAASDS